MISNKNMPHTYLPQTCNMQQNVALGMRLKQTKEYCVLKVKYYIIIIIVTAEAMFYITNYKYN